MRMPGGATQTRDPILQRACTDLFELLVSLDLPEQVDLLAARLRARFGLKTPDALRASQGLAVRITAS
jgi:hypothetical protein